MNYKIITITILTVFMYSCKNNSNSKIEYIATNSSVIYEHPGKKLMETNCYACHNPTTSHENRLAPPMIAIKKHYLSYDITKDEFVLAIQNWIENPNEADAKMFGAVRRFGVMPKQPFSKEVIEQIADYMYNNDIEQPEWFEEHFNNMKGMGKSQN